MAPPSSVQPPRSALVQRTVEYRVSGALNGVTPTDGTASIDEENIWVVPVDGDAGLFDPSRFSDGRGSIANRYVDWIEVVLASGVAPAGARISIVDANSLVPTIANVIELRRIANIAGQARYYSDQPFFVSQCTSISIRGILAPSAGRYHRVLFGVKQPTSPFEEALLVNAMCACQPTILSGDGGGISPGGGGDTLQVYDFSNGSILLGTATGPAYFFFSSALPDPESFFNASNAAFTDPSVTPEEVGSVKLAIRAGSLTRIVLRSTVSFTYRWFIDVSVGGGAFVRTFVMAANAVLAANTTTIVVPTTVVSFGAGDRYRVGMTVTGSNITTQLQVSIEITTPAP